MQEADPGRDQTFVLTPQFKRDLPDPLIWRRLREEAVGLNYLWQDRQSGQWYAHAVYPWLPDDDLPHWSLEYDSRHTLMQSGATAEEAVLKLFDDPRMHVKYGVGKKLMRLTVEVVNLTRAIQNERH